LVRGPAVLVVALLGPFVVTLALRSVRDSVANTNSALLLVLVIVGVAASGRRLPGVLAALSAAVWFDFFLTQPFHRFAIDDRDDLETAVLLSIVGIGVTELALWGRRQQARLSERDGYLDGVMSAADIVARGEASPQVVLDLVGRQIVELLGVDSCTYGPGPPGAHARLERDGTVSRDGHVIDVERSGLPTNDVIELPLGPAARPVGRFVLTASTHVVWTTPEQRRVAVTLADQAASALGSAPQAGQR